MRTPIVFAAAALALVGITGTVSAQPYGSYQRDRDDDYWRGAPDGLQARIAWLQQRIDRGRADGTLDRDEARRAQSQLDYLRGQANDLERRLDDLNRNIRWYRNNDRYGYNDRDRYATDYDASRYYREEPGYERRLGPNDEVYRGSDGRYYCKRSDGTTGLVIGGIGGAALGNVIDGGHNRVAGTLIGGAIGALIGKSVDQNNSDLRCR